MTEETSDYTPVMLDPHTTSPGHRETVIVRNAPVVTIDSRQSEIYTRARQIYTRARRASRVRGSGIL